MSRSVLDQEDSVAVARAPDLVLFVEDAADTRGLHTIHLRKAGYRVAEATNGVEGVERAIQLQPSLVLMDLAMPLVDGFEATRRLKNHPKTAHIPVIILTSYGYQGYLKEAAACGCDGFLTKPVGGPALIERVRSMIDTRRSGVHRMSR